MAYRSAHVAWSSMKEFGANTTSNTTGQSIGAVTMETLMNGVLVRGPVETPTVLPGLDKNLKTLALFQSQSLIY